MRAKCLGRPLLLLVTLTLAAGVASAQDPKCGPPGTGQPWGCELDPNFPPTIAAVNGVIDSSLVMRERQNSWVPVWTSTTCANNGFRACASNADCGAGGSCINAQKCSDTGKTCSSNTDCGTDAECVKTWGWLAQTLRSYGNPIGNRPIDPNNPPKNPNDPNIRWGYPGPIFRARAATLKDPAQPPGPSNPVVTPGSRIKIGLFNYLTPQSVEDAKKCNPASYKSCSATNFCLNSSFQEGAPCSDPSQCPPGNACLPRPCTTDADCTGAGTCVTKNVDQTAPNCYHGNSVTNLHLHGTHVSPQPPQDFVLLNLFPYDSPGPIPGPPNFATGFYQVDVNPLPWNQAPGTHWYHPHKHGSTTPQVQNGMAGGLIIEGAFDDWLQRFYGGKLVDRVLAVQEIAGQVVPGSQKFFNPFPAQPFIPPQALLNGYATPQITMRAGEVQRWRFVGGTTQLAASLEIGFDTRIQKVVQISQDGIQFAWQNYCRQPLRDDEGTFNNFKLGPGNRADFLVQAPPTPGIYTVTRRVTAQNLSEEAEEQFNLDATVLERVPPTQLTAGVPPVDNGGNPLLFTIRVVAESAGTNGTNGTNGATAAGSGNFPWTQGIAGEACDPDVPVKDECKGSSPPPQCWPATPYFLRDLPATGRPPDQRVVFKINGNNARQPNSFWINDSQYCPSCAPITTALGATQEWVVANKLGTNNSSMLAHPFHIHVNPFQIVANADRKFDPPFIWSDTIALPTQTTTDRPAGPIWDNADAKAKCQRACDADHSTWNGQWTTTIPNQMSVCGCTQQGSEVLIRHRFEDYTGGYVFHCHILGHEDRGMMWNVQTVCKPGSGYGTPQPSGGADNCAVSAPGVLPSCPANNTCPDAGSHGH